MVPAAPLTTGVTDARRASHLRAPLSVEVVTDDSAFARLAGEWDDAVERAQVPHPFLHHKWVSAWWSCFAAGRRLHVVVVRSAGRITAIAPLMLETARMYRVPVRRLRMMENDHTPRIDFIVAADAEASYRAIWTTLLDDRRSWDVLQLSQIPRGSKTLAAMRQLASESACPSGVWCGEASPYLPIERSWSDYTSGLGAKFRQNLRNRMGRLEKLGHPALEVLDDDQSVRAAQPDALRLEASGWKAGEGTAIASAAETHRFYTTFSFNGVRDARSKQLFLTVDGRRIATAYTAEYGNRLFLLKTGYDVEFAKCAPFKLLTQLALRDAFDRGLSEFDFLGRSEPWKVEWTPLARHHDWLFIFSNRLRGRVVHQVKFHLLPAVKARLHR